MDNSRGSWLSADLDQPTSQDKTIQNKKKIRQDKAKPFVRQLERQFVAISGNSLPCVGAEKLQTPYSNNVKTQNNTNTNAQAILNQYYGNIEATLTKINSTQTILKQD